MRRPETSLLDLRKAVECPDSRASPVGFSHHMEGLGHTPLNADQVDDPKQRISLLESQIGRFYSASSCLCRKSLRVVVAATGEFDVLASRKNSRDETGLDGCGSHTSDHDRGLAKKAREGRVDMPLPSLTDSSVNQQNKTR
ncbi:hypothetical protein M407DRAFT_125884 [Tulasnella calospora MUT 4182]|uniref:Uncharacterized protein n=1 Tax=Tulasnella calospora MUT 4182 TaxID=1051891 RepID=A0A0C3LJ45_9AGAM|nr:hypothetical protein M407DRAFT_125884 [Tulasnella calospora MUT 4182]